jgi:hypothetical protein
MAMTADNGGDFLRTRFLELAERVKVGQVIVVNMSVSGGFNGVETEFSCREPYTECVVNERHWPLVNGLPSNFGKDIEGEAEDDEPDDSIEEDCDSETIDGDEYPMLLSDKTTEDYITRVLQEMGRSGTFSTHKTIFRPGKSPLIEVEGAVY